MGTCRGQSSEEFDEKIILNKKKQATCQYIGKYFGVTLLTSSRRFKVRQALLVFLPRSPAVINEWMISAHSCAKVQNGVFGSVTLIKKLTVTNDVLVMKTVSLEFLKGE